MRKLLVPATALVLAVSGCSRTGIERDFDAEMDASAEMDEDSAPTPEVEECDPNFSIAEFERFARAELPEEEICRLILEQQAKLLCSLENDTIGDVVEDGGYEIIDDFFIETSSDTFRLGSGREIRCSRYIEIENFQGAWTDWNCEMLQDGIRINLFAFEFDDPNVPESQFEVSFIDEDVYLGTYLDSNPTKYRAYNTVGIADYDCGSNLHGHDENVSRFNELVDHIVSSDTE